MYIRNPKFLLSYFVHSYVLLKKINFAITFQKYPKCDKIEWFCIKRGASILTSCGEPMVYFIAHQ